MLGQIQMTYSDKEKRLTNKVEKIDTVGGDHAEMADQVIHRNVRSITSRSKSGIQLIQSRFKLIRFNDSRRGQIRELVGDKDAMADVMDIPGNADNCLPFKNNIEYEWARFMQASKMTKRSMTMFFSNPTLAPIWEYLSFKNVAKMRALSIKLLYDKLTWWTRSLNICSIIANVAPKEYLMYYLDIVPAIQFLIGHWLFAPHLAYTPV